MNNIYEIKPVFNISDEDNKLIEKIEYNLSKINITDASKKNILKIKSKVRSISSSLAIEGNTLSLDTIYDITNNKLVLGKRDEIQEVKNAYELYKNISNFNWKNEKDLKKAHLIMMKYFEDDNGDYRNHGEAVKKGNKIIFTAPDSIFVGSLMKSLFEYINNNENNIHPLILSSIFHYYFVYIHPFTDGNGRIARFWVNLILIDYNSNFEYIPIEEELYIKVNEYFNSISKSHNNGNANAFIRFMLKSINNSILRTTQKTTQIKLNNNQVKIIDFINNNPYITRKQMAILLKITEDGVKYNLNKLSKNGVIERIGSDKSGYWKVK